MRRRLADWLLRLSVRIRPAPTETDLELHKRLYYESCRFDPIDDAVLGKWARMLAQRRVGDEMARRLAER